jgi:5-formyltetrahydrofolate cyclo-ligase
MSAAADHPAAVPSPQNAKTALRRSLLASRRTHPAGPEAEAQRCAALLAVPELAAAKVVAGYAALPGEPNIGAALEALRSRGVAVVLPVVAEDRDLDFCDRDGRVVAASEIDVVLAPAVAADRRGGRLGRGGGSYDRALLRVRPDALVVAIVHANELVDAVPIEVHDHPVGAILAGDELLRVTQ